MLTSEVRESERPRTRDERAAATANAILEAALKCFNRRGTETTSIEDIAKEAGVSRTLVHYHFKTRDDLFIKVQMHLVEAISRRTLEAVARLGPSPAHAGAALDEVWDLLRQAKPFTPILLQLMARAANRASHKTKFQAMVDDYRRMLVQGIRSILGSTGTVPDAQVPMIAEFILSTLAGLYLSALYSEDPELTNAAYREFRDLVINRWLAPRP